MFPIDQSLYLPIAISTYLADLVYHNTNIDLIRMSLTRTQLNHMGLVSASNQQRPHNGRSGLA